MSQKHSIAARKRMAKYTPEELSARMSATRKAGWARKTPAERAAVGKKLTRARKLK